MSQKKVKFNSDMLCDGMLEFTLPPETRDRLRQKNKLPSEEDKDATVRPDTPSSTLQRMDEQPLEEEEDKDKEGMSESNPTPEGREKLHVAMLSAETSLQEEDKLPSDSTSKQDTPSPTLRHKNKLPSEEDKDATVRPDTPSSTKMEI